MIAVAGALFRIFLLARLAGRGETKTVAVTMLLSELLHKSGEISGWYCSDSRPRIRNRANAIVSD